MGESQLVELQNMRVLLEEARLLARNLAYHRERGWRMSSVARWMRWTGR
jgi:hypothetical protein